MPIWTDPCLEESPVQDWTIRNVLCAVNVNPHNHKTVSWAAHIAGAIGARLSLAHVSIRSMELSGVRGWTSGSGLSRRLETTSALQILRYRDWSKARSLGDGRHRRGDVVVKPARFQNVSSTSRFILRLLVMYRLVVATDACPR